MITSTLGWVLAFSHLPSTSNMCLPPCSTLILDATAINVEECIAFANQLSNFEVQRQRSGTSRASTAILIWYDEQPYGLRRYEVRERMLHAGAFPAPIETGQTLISLKLREIKRKVYWHKFYQLQHASGVSE